MKVIATTTYGYLVEVTPRELVQISGNEKLSTHPSSYYNSERNPVPAGTEVNVSEMYQHVEKVTKHANMRKSIAEQLRAAATVVETTMDVVSIPVEKTETASTQERIEA